jgi:hypothetical protein
MSDQAKRNDSATKELKSCRVALTPASQELVRLLAQRGSTNASAVVEIALLEYYARHQNQTETDKIATRLEYLIGMVESIQGEMKE